MTAAITVLIYLLGFQSGLLVTLAARVRKLMGTDRDRQLLDRLERAVIEGR
jgi:hypothetical protein